MPKSLLIKLSEFAASLERASESECYRPLPHELPQVQLLHHVR